MLENMMTLWQSSGLLTAWHTISHWLALDARQLIFVLATPFFIGVAVWEYRKIRLQPTLMNLQEALKNFMLGAGYQLTELLFAGLIAFPVYALAYHYRLFSWELTAATAIFTLISVDFCFYWMHRCSHRLRWFWAAHVVHHSSERFNFSTAMRQNATNIFNGNWLFYVPLAVLGLNPIWIGIAFALSLVYQFFIHTTLIKKLHPAIEYLFNTPSHHRVHHGRNEGYIDRNYGGILIIWDRLFATFVDEQAQQPPQYGITRPPKDDSLLTLCTHEYVALFHDMQQSGPLQQRLKHLIMPPDWQRSQQTATRYQPPSRSERED